MNREFYHQLAAHGLADRSLDAETCERILTDPQIEILPLLDAAYQVRRKFHGREVQIHIINNAQNGHCPEDCSYCAQAKTSQASIADYPMKSDEEMLSEAKQAYDSGAFRYCMVFAGRGPSKRRVERLAGLIERIKQTVPIQLCLSAGLIDSEDAARLKAAGLDRLNHNLNTSERHYRSICTTHTYQDRVNTLNAANSARLQLCSGLIAGMGESARDLVQIALTLRRLKVSSIPVNFLVPIEGNVLDHPTGLTPTFCLRLLCMVRFTNPTAEIRAAAGREGHLRSMEVMALYAANSLFMDGYLNTRGEARRRTLQMIRDAGFTVSSDFDIDKLLEQESDQAIHFDLGDGSGDIMKSIADLRPHE